MTPRPSPPIPALSRKVPLTHAGLEAAAALAGEHGVSVCTTACYAPHQALSSAAIGAAYVAPYLGRIDDAAGRDGAEEVALMQAALDRTRSPTRLLVASLRSAALLPALAARGCDTFTFSPDVARELVADPMTAAAAAEFERAAAAPSSPAAASGGVPGLY